MSVPRHFGGSVPYLICPGDDCGRRVSKLYQNSGRLRCRQCSNLVFHCGTQMPAKKASGRFSVNANHTGGLVPSAKPLFFAKS